MRSDSVGLTRPGWWFVAAGVLVIVRAAMELADPVYWEPVSFLDFSAVILTTVGWVAAGWAVMLLSRRPELGRASLVLAIAGMGLVVEGVGNLLEDLFDLTWGGDLYSWGGIIGAIALIVGSVLALTVGHRLRWSALFLLVFIAGGIFPDDGGLFVGGLSLVGLGYWLISQQRDEPVESRT